MIRDTVRQSLASRGFWLLLGLSGLCIVLCLSVSVEGATAVKPPGEIELFGRDRQPYTGLNPTRGTISLGFGAVRVEQWRDPESSVRLLEVLLALIVGGAVGMMLLTITDDAGKEIALRRGITESRWTWIVGKDGQVIYKNVNPDPVEDARQVLKFLTDLNAREQDRR